jgi:hypothetical protein
MSHQDFEYVYTTDCVKFNKAGISSATFIHYMPSETAVQNKFKLGIKYSFLSIPVTSKQGSHIVAKRSLCYWKLFVEDEQSNVDSCSV